MIPEDMRDLVYFAVNSVLIKFKESKPFAGQMTMDIMSNLDRLDFREGKDE